MVKTMRERAADYRRNLKLDSDKYKLYLEKERKRKQKKRAEEKKNRSQDELLKLREKDKLRQRKYRLQKKEALKSGVKIPYLGSFSSEAELNKAVQKVEKSLPSSPNLRRAVLSQLAKEIFGKNLFNVKKNKHR